MISIRLARVKQRRWRAGLHGGTATMTDLRPGLVNGDRCTQDQAPLTRHVTRYLWHHDHRDPHRRVDPS